jgi:ATP-binding cassette subfamily C protein
MLGLGGYLAIQNELSPGAIIAASIMMSRALAPIEIAIGHWRNFVGARESHRRLKKFLAAGRARRGATALPAPKKLLAVENIVVAVPGSDKPIIRGISFQLSAGSALAIFGRSAAGKSTLVRSLVGVWPLAGGQVRLDGATLDQYPEEQIGSLVGYLPQDVELLEGTVAENIARFDPKATDSEIVDAAMKAGAHDMILRLSKGYDTLIGEGGTRLSGGQRQRVALARALFRDPFLVVLDEPNSNLDGTGDQALNEAINSVRRRGGVVVVVSHRTATIAVVDHVAVLSDGRFEEYGTRDQIMPKLIRSSSEQRPAITSDKARSTPVQQQVAKV